MIIYKVTNKLNGKLYIGQTTVNLSHRKSQHKSSCFTAKQNNVFYMAIRKYKWKNFKWEVIDKASSLDELNEKEMYWINYYRTFIGFKDCNGYNMTLGGEGTVGIGNVTVDQVIKIKKLLTNSSLSYLEIAEAVGVTIYNVKDIYCGKTYAYIGVKGFVPNMERNITNKHLSEEIVIRIKSYLMENKYNSKEIASKLGIGINAVSGIKTLRYYTNIHVEGFEQKMNILKMQENEKYAKAKVLLMGQEHTLDEISSLVGLHKSTIENISKNRTGKDVFIEGFEEWSKNFDGNHLLKTEEVKVIKKLLMEETKSPLEISKMFGVARSVIYAIKRGDYYKDVYVEGFIPFKDEGNISKFRRGYKHTEEAKRIMSKIKTGKSLSNEHKIKISKSHKKNMNFNLNKLSIEQVIEIKKLLLNSEVSMQKIADRYSISRYTVYQINVKKIWSQIKLINEPEGKYRNTDKNLMNSMTSHAKLNEEIIKEILIKLKNGTSNKVIQNEYKISKSTVTAIKMRKAWKWVRIDDNDNGEPIVNTKKRKY